MDGSTLIIALLGAAFVGVVGLWSIDRLIERPMVAIGLVLGATVLGGALAESVGVAVGGFSIYIRDVVSVMVLAAGIARLIRLPRRSAPHWMIVALCLLALTPLARGLMQFGVQESVNEFRRFLAWLAPALYVSTVDIDDLFPRRLPRLWWTMASVLTVVVFARWLNNFVGVPIGVFAADFGAPVRALDGAETFFLAEAFLLTLPEWTRDDAGPWPRRISILLGVVVVLLNRRTIWLTLVAAVLVLIMRNQHLGRRIVALSLGAAVVTAVVVVNLPQDAAPQDAAVAESATDLGTFDWRIEGWQELLTMPETLTHWTFGMPYGAGFDRRVADVVVVQSPHNFYLETMLRLGLTGLAIFLALYVRAFDTFLARSRADPEGPATTLLVLLTAQVIWLITWGPGYEQGLLVGLAAAGLVKWGGPADRVETPPDRVAPPAISAEGRWTPTSTRR